MQAAATCRRRGAQGGSSRAAVVWNKSLSQPYLVEPPVHEARWCDGMGEKLHHVTVACQPAPAVHRQVEVLAE